MSNLLNIRLNYKKTLKLMKKMKFQEIEQREMPLINCKIGLKLK